GVDEVGWCFGSQNDDGGARFGGFGNSCASVCEATALVYRNHANLAAHSRIGICHGGGSTLVPCCGVGDARSAKGICDFKVATTHHSKDMSNVEMCQVPANLVSDCYHRGSLQFLK